MSAALLVATQGIAAVTFVQYASDQLLDQIDERLVAALGATGGIDDVYQGTLEADRTLVTVNSAMIRDRPAAAPSASALASADLGDTPVTVRSTDPELEYRVVAAATPGGTSTEIFATPLRGYEWTVGRLTRLAAIVAVSTSVVTLAALWWVWRHGLRPLREMTEAAQAVAEGQLSQRIAEPDPATEAGQLGEALNSMMGHIEMSFAERDASDLRLRNFVADVSHELRTPIATIRGYAELYESGGLSDEDALHDAMRRTRLESERMSRLVSDMVDLARVDDAPAPRLKSVDLNEVAADVTEAARARHASLVLRLELADEPAAVTADELLLQQAIANLVDNAAIHAGGHASIEIAVSAEPTTAVTVSDDGRGMSPDEVQRATERGYRGYRPGSDTASSPGSGLGLAIVSRIAELHGGSLVLTSQPGAGTSATLRLPPAGDD